MQLQILHCLLIKVHFCVGMVTVVQHNSINWHTFKLIQLLLIDYCHFLLLRNDNVADNMQFELRVIHSNIKHGPTKTVCAERIGQLFY